MTILTSELKYYKSKSVSDLVTNGGRMSASQIITNIKNNIFPDVSELNREAGLVQYRKLFCKNANDAGEIFYASRLHFQTITPGDDIVYMIEGTQRNTQDDLTGSEDKYGIGNLNANISASGTSLEVAAESSSYADIFPDGCTIFISDGVNYEYHENVTLTSTIGNIVKLDLEALDVFVNSFTTANTIVAAVIESGDVEPTFDSWSETVAGDGTYDTTGYPVVLNNIGAVDEDWTLTFTSATEFSLTGDTLGAVDTGDVNTIFSPTNTDFSKPYFVLNANGWSGTFASGDVITFTTHASSIPVIHVRVVPAGAAAVANNNYEQVFDGDSAPDITSTSTTTT